MRRAPGDGGIATSLEGIAHLLRDEPLAVPPYQRDYSWQRDQVAAFWQDLRAALVAEQHLYFLGTVVLSASAGGAADRSIVIDGQQRLATTSMLLAAVRNAYASRGDDARASFIESNYVLSTSLVSAEREPRLDLNTNDRDFFKAHVLAGSVPAEDAARPSHQLIASAFSLLTDNLDQDLQSAGPHWPQRLEAWVTLLDRDARVIAVHVQDDADAFLIFETLNDRGLVLTIADVIKNYLFGITRTNLPVAERYWTEMMQALDDVAAASGTTTFLRQWWSAQHGATRERDLYRSVRSAVRQPAEALETLESFSNAAPLFAAALDSQHDLWMTQFSAAQPIMETLLRLGLEQYRPLLLAALARLPEQKVPDLMHALACWSARGLVVGGIGGGTTERYFAEAAVRVFQRRSRSVASVLQDLDPVVASDDEFQAVFAARRGIRVGLAKYLLSALSQLGERDRPAIVPDSFDRDLAVVRLLPASGVAGWHSFDPESTKLWANRLGNLFLVDRSVARNLSTDPDERVGAVVIGDRWYGGETDGWTPEAIERRQAAIARAALEVWPRQPRSN